MGLLPLYQWLLHYKTRGFAMDRFLKKLTGSRLTIVYLLGTSIGCVANPVPIPTFWDKLGIPQATAILRDSTINRSGRFPGLEKKPPLLKIADPANLKPEKPEMIQVELRSKLSKTRKNKKSKLSNSWLT